MAHATAERKDVAKGEEGDKRSHGDGSVPQGKHPELTTNALEARRGPLLRCVPPPPPLSPVSSLDQQRLCLVQPPQRLQHARQVVAGGRGVGVLLAQHAAADVQSLQRSPSMHWLRSGALTCASAAGARW